MMNQTNQKAKQFHVSLDELSFKIIYAVIVLSFAAYFLTLSLWNYLVDNKNLISYIFFITSFLYIVFYLTTKNSNTLYFKRGKTIFYGIVIVSMDFDFFLNGGIYSPTIFMYFPLSILILFLTEQFSKRILISLLFINLTLSFIINYCWPQFILRDSSNNEIIERNISLILICIYTTYIIIQILNKYIQDKDSAIRSEEEKSKFLANMSHMIRTPLNSINGFADFLLDEEISQSEKQYFVKRMKENAQNLNRLISDLIDLAIIQENSIKLYKTTFTINQIIEKLIEKADLQISSEGKNISFIVSQQEEIESLILNTDETKLIELLWKIIDNAIKYTISGQISMHVSFLSEENWISFSIKDTGIGMTETQVTHIFDLINKQSTGNKSNETSPGLGLNIAKGLIDFLDGKVEINSLINKGTEVTILLPKTMII